MIDITRFTNQITLETFQTQRANHIDTGWGDFPEFSLSEDDKEKLIEVIGGLEKNKGRTRQFLDNLGGMSHHWALERLHYNGGKWSYCAGQDYRHELRQLRQHIKGCINA